MVIILPIEESFWLVLGIFSSFPYLGPNHPNMFQLTNIFIETNYHFWSSHVFDLIIPIKLYFAGKVQTTSQHRWGLTPLSERPLGPRRQKPLLPLALLGRRSSERMASQRPVLGWISIFLVRPWGNDRFLSVTIRCGLINDFTIDDIHGFNHGKWRFNQQQWWCKGL